MRDIINESIAKAKIAAEKRGAELIVHSNAFIDDNHLDCSWYRDSYNTQEIMSLQYHGFMIKSVVTGEVRLVYGTDVYKYSDEFPFKNDDELYEKLERGEAYFDNNNWIELYVYKLTEDAPEFIEGFIEDTNNVLEPVDSVDFLCNWIDEDFIRGGK